MPAADFIERIPNYSPTATAEEGMWFDEAEAQRALDFFRIHLKFIRGDRARAAEPFVLEPWQASIVVNVFGWRKKDGTRRYGKVFLFVARKNGKTSLLAGILLYLGFCSGEPGSQIYSAANDREQAGLLYDDMEAMIARNPYLSRRATCTKAYKKIEIRAKERCVYKALSREKSVGHGIDPYALCIDELHCIDNTDYISGLTTGGGARTNGLLFYTTTAGVFKPTSPCYKEYTYACNVRDGIVADHTYLPIVYEAHKEDDYRDPETWKKANPNLGVSVKYEYLESECRKAQESPIDQNTFLRYYCNLWTEQLERFIDMDKWRECEGLPSTDKELVWFGGLDMSSTTDLTAFVLAAQDKEGYIHVHCYPFAPKDSCYLREQRDKAPYLTWHKQGKLELTEGNVVDYDVVRNTIKELGEQFNIKEIAVDRWNTTQITTQLQGDGFTVVPFGQGFASMSAPTKFLEQLVLNKQIKHGNHPALTWCVSNLMVERDAAENLKPSKQKSTERIDVAVALIMALGRLTQSDTTPQESVYESRGILFF